MAGVAALIGSVFAVLRTLFGRGRSEGRLMAEIENAHRDVGIADMKAQSAITRADLVNAELHEHKVETAEKFGRLEALTIALNQNSEQLRALTERLDRVLEANGRTRR